MDEKTQDFIKDMEFKFKKSELTANPQEYSTQVPIPILAIFISKCNLIFKLNRI